MALWWERRGELVLLGGGLSRGRKGSPDGGMGRRGIRGGGKGRFVAIRMKVATVCRLVGGTGGS